MKVSGMKVSGMKVKCRAYSCETKIPITYTRWVRENISESKKVMHDSFSFLLS